MYSVLKECNFESIEKIVKNFLKLEKAFFSSTYNLLDHRESQFDEFYESFLRELDAINVKF
jgi:hypothetical protein